MIGIGIDMIKVSRLCAWNKKEKLLLKYFSEEEIVFARRKKNVEQSLASCFAAKEAFKKATVAHEVQMKDVIMLHKENGAPFLKTQNSAQIVMEKLGAQTTFVSISHEKKYAIAVVAVI